MARQFGFKRGWKRLKTMSGPLALHSTRTAVAAVLSFLVARWFGLAEAYWAPVTTLVITQSSFGAAFSVSWERLMGTLLGAAVGAVAATYFGPSAWVFAAGVFLLGPLTALTGGDRSAYRFAGVTLAVVLLIPRTNPPWVVAAHRAAEVAIGIAVALALALAWPDPEGARGAAR